MQRYVVSVWWMTKCLPSWYTQSMFSWLCVQIEKGGSCWFVSEKKCYWNRELQWKSMCLTFGNGTQIHFSLSRQDGFFIRIASSCVCISVYLTLGSIGFALHWFSFLLCVFDPFFSAFCCCLFHSVFDIQWKLHVIFVNMQAYYPFITPLFFSSHNDFREMNGWMKREKKENRNNRSERIKEYPAYLPQRF